MANLTKMVADLEAKQKRTRQELQRIEDAISALKKLSGARESKGKRGMSAAARRRISRAQKARWAKHRRAQAA